MIFTTDSFSTRRLSANDITELFNQFSQTVSGLNQIISPDAQLEKDNESDITAQKEKKKWNIFLGIAILASVLLIGYMLTSKK